jgi:hypothetical protein
MYAVLRASDQSAEGDWRYRRLPSITAVRDDLRLRRMSLADA